MMNKSPKYLLVAFVHLALSSLAFAQTPLDSKSFEASSGGPPLVEGLMPTTAGDPDWVLAVSDLILRQDLCVASFPCQPDAWYERLNPSPCYDRTRYYKLAPGAATAAAYPIGALAPFGVDSIHVRGGHTAQLFFGFNNDFPATEVLQGPKTFTISLWQFLNCDGLDEGTVVVPGIIPGKLSYYSLRLGATVATELDCEEFDRFETLTPNDTLTLLSKVHNPGLEQGYLYVNAANATRDPYGFDYLIGNYMVIDGFQSIEYSINAVDFRAAVAEGVPTDLDMDGNLDLNGVEYERTAGEILIPRFLGQTENTSSELLLVALSGGTQFTTTLDFLIYNDNEQVFSSQYTFDCWDKVPLKDISQLFDSSYLAQFTGDDPEESISGQEAGWIRIDGSQAYSSATTIDDPAFYAVLVERIGASAAGADLPFERCLQNGSLLPRAQFGDNGDGNTSQSCENSIGRREPGSLLLFPEFDNRSGTYSIITVTNTNPYSSTEVHYTYIGRYGL